MGIINITATDVYVALRPNDLLKSPIKFGWTHAAGVLEVTLPHDLANTIRALVMMTNDYPEAPLPANISPVETKSITGYIHYTDIGDMDYSSTLNIRGITALKMNEVVLETTTYHFDLSSYITTDEEGNEIHIEPPYSYYEGKTMVRLTIPKTVVEKSCKLLNDIYPYSRFQDLNENIYKYVKTKG